MTPQEQQNEAQFNQISNTVIGQTSWGQFYGLMRSAASIGQGALPHKICIGKDGGQIQVYNTRTNKLLAAFMKPTHEYVQKYLAEKSYGEAALAALGLYGQLKSVKDQEAATCFEVTPNFIIEQQARKEKEDADKKQSESDATKRKIESDKFYKKPKFYIISGSVLLGAGLIILIARAW